MSVEKKKWVAVVAKLNRLTQEEELVWERMDIPTDLQTGSNDLISSFYGTNFHGRNIGIYEERYRDYIPDFDTFVWDSRIVLAFFTEDWQRELAFPGASGTIELMDAVRHQTAGVEEFLDEVLKEDQDET